jgi:asparagine synthase (glutamine-hydrolysing)
MCGIVVLHRAGRAPQMQPMLDAIVHRGPDDDGIIETGETTLGVRRLAIIDVPGGHQPLANEDRTLWVAFNGEIYNHRALRGRLEKAGHRFRTASDTEVLVHGYEAWGWDGLLGRLNGMFAFALVDTRTRTCLLARDRLGEKPLYLARAGTGWAAASEIKALFAHPQIAPVLDEERISESLANRFVTGERTAFANVTKVRPGSWVRLEELRVTHGRYWEVPRDQGAQRAQWAQSDISSQVRERVLASVSARLIADVPLGALLSGGLDSSVIVAAMRRAGADPLRTYTVGFEPAHDDERGAARLVARHVGTEHTEQVVSLDAAALLPEVVWHLDEPLGDAAALPTLLISRAAREHVTVVLSGEGSDELFLGYPRYLLSRLADRALALPEALRGPLFGIAARLFGGRAHLALARLAHAPADALVRNALWMSGAAPATVAALCRRPAVGWERWFVPEAGAATTATLEDVLRRDLTAWLVDDVLLKADKMSMAASLESRAPFLDHELVELVAGLPLELRFANRNKRWLRRAFAPDLPAATVRRAKHPFRPPVAAWFRGALGLELEATVSRPSSFTARYLERDVVRTLLREHRAGADHALLLWSLLVHETWWERFFTPEVRVA